MLSLPKQVIRICSGCRTYARVLRRRPLAVSMGPDAVKHVAGVDDSQVGEWLSPHLGKMKAKVDNGRHQKLQLVTPPSRDETEQEDRFQLPPGMTYEKLEQGDKRFGPVVMAARNRKAREKQGSMVLEGRRLIRDAILAEAEITAFYFTKVEHLEGIPLEATSAKLYKVHYNQMKTWSDVRTPPGLLAICKMPKAGIMPDAASAVSHLPLTLICDNIRDPGNMGTLLRTAAAIRCRTVLAMKGCVDIWDPKVLRAGAGAHFLLHILPNISWHNAGNYIPQQTSVYLADGSVQHQVPERVKSSVMKKITEAEFEKFTELDEETRETIEVDTSYMDKKHVKLFEKFPIAAQSCFECDFSSEDSVLVIGGETHGLSAEAHKFAFDRNGEKVFIPMEEGIDSLNASIAATVVLFEMKRQYAANNSESRRAHQESEHI